MGETNEKKKKKNDQNNSLTPRDVNADAAVLLSAIQDNDWTAITELLKQGASSSTLVSDPLESNKKTTLLHEMAKAPISISGGGSEHETALRAILKNVAKVTVNLNVVNEEGNTALHLCGKHGNYTMCVLLLEAGALRNICNQNGETAMEMTETILMELQKPTQLFLDTLSVLSKEEIDEIETNEEGNEENNEKEDKEEKEENQHEELHKEKDDAMDVAQIKEVDAEKEKKVVIIATKEDRIQFEATLSTLLFNQATEEGYQYALRHGEYMHAFMVAKQCNDSDKEHYALHQWTTQKVLSSALTTKYTDRIPPLPSVNNSSNSTTATTATTATNATNATANTTNTAISTAHQDIDDMASWIQAVSNLFLSNNTDETKNTPTNV